LSSSSALNVQDRDRQIQIIQREQQRLWEDFDWPHLRVERFFPLQAGQRYYDLAACLNEEGTVKGDLDIDRVYRVDVKFGGAWLPVHEGITQGDMFMYDSALDQRATPVCKWRLSEDEQIEVWPIPDTSATAADQEGYLRVTGIRKLRTFVDDSDRADLDDTLLSLYAAGAILVDQNSKSAQIKLEAAQKHYARLRGSLSKSRGFQMFGVGLPKDRPRRMYITRYVPPS
jgi:hypothetical protein